MAIEDGLLPLAYVTHTYQISTTVQIFLINRFPPPKHPAPIGQLANYMSLFFKLYQWEQEMAKNSLEMLKRRIDASVSKYSTMPAGVMLHRLKVGGLI